MAKIDMIESHVETLLERVTGNERLRRDNDGDWAFDLPGDGVMYVRLRDAEPPRVELRAHVGTDFPLSVRLLLDTHELNANALYCRVCLYGEHVVVESDLVATDLDHGELEIAMDVLFATVDRINDEYTLEWMAADAIAD